MLSIIVPVYNAEKYIDRCIDSILKQTYPDFELIIIDDGSTDMTPIICDNYARIDKRAIVIHQKNIGLLATREKGVSSASGELIGFVDADDWVEPEYFENLVGQMVGRDIVSAGVTNVYADEDGREEEEHNKLESGIYETDDRLTDLFSHMLCNNPPFEFGVLPYMWNKIFRKDILLPILKEVDKTIFDGEDVAVAFPYMVRAKSIVLSDYCGYHYTIQSQSMSHKKRRGEYYNESCLYSCLYKQFSKSQYNDILIPQLNRYILMMFWKRNPADFIEANKFVFPYGRIPYGSKIALYGAGDLGKAYLSQLKQNGYCSIVAVADMKFEGESKSNMEISPRELVGIDCDYVVISVANKKSAESIKKYLMGIGIEEGKIVI
jgi:glycosyltransferase involved in cell wall biosynthesis